MSRSAARLLVTSASILFAELLLLRWIPSYVAYIAFFANILLIASFLGIGVGVLLGARFPRARVVGPLLFATVVLVLGAQLDVPGVPRAGTDADPRPLVIALIVALVAAVIGALALPLGPLLRAFTPLRAYALDIAGSLVGIAAFAALAALGTPPVVWFAALAGLLVVGGILARPDRWSAVTALSLLGVIGVAALAQDVSGDRWSPYNRLSLFGAAGGPRILAANGIPHQTFYAVGDPGREPFYDQVYRWLPRAGFERVLVIGAGNGTDVAGALARGATRVDAVEIDPAILELGVALHPDRPYADARVHRAVDDGRAFLRRSSERYDLIVFALTDSLTVLTSSSDLRLESFLYTRESFADAAAHLTDDGVIALYNYYREPWLVPKLGAMLEEAVGSPPLVRLYPGRLDIAAAFAAGPGVERARARGEIADASLPLARPAPRPATDDWPFLYLERPAIGGQYQAALAVLLAGAAVALALALRVARAPVRAISPHFFALGAAFLLLETRSLATFSLLFGTTWLVNALVFFAVLASVLAAVAIGARWRVRDPRPLYLALGASLLVAYLLPPSALLVDPPALRYALASVVTFAPIALANLVFVRSFRDASSADTAFASNVLGAVAGGVLEYGAALVGYQALLVVVAACYGLAYALLRWPHLGDRMPLMPHA